MGLASLTAAQNPGGMPMQNSNDSMRPHNIHIGLKRMGIRPPKPIGTIDVIGAPSNQLIRPPAPRENVIQVMTADRREYSRTVVNQNQPQMPPMFNVPPEEFYNHEEQDAFNYGYEPTQDSSQWTQEGNQGWAPSEIKELTSINQPPPMGPRMHQSGPPNNLNIPPPIMGNMPPRMQMKMMPPQNMIPPLMGNMPPMQIKQEMDDKRDMRRMGGNNRDFRDDRRPSHDDRKRMRERSASREREMMRKTDSRSRDERPRSERDRYTRETSSRRRSKSRERSKRSRSRDKPVRSKSRDRKTDDKERSRGSDKSKRDRSKKEEA